MERFILPKSLYFENPHLMNHIIWGGKPIMRQLHDTDATIAPPKGYVQRKVGTLTDCGNGFVSITAY